MREIKFKVWDIGKKVFIPTDVYALLLTGEKGFGIMTKDWENYREGEYFYENSQTLIQFTGLLDKNGKEIYEGDIVQDVVVKMKSAVVFTDYANFGLKSNLKDNEYETIDPAFTETSIEIIGNIYENENLLT